MFVLKRANIACRQHMTKVYYFKRILNNFRFIQLQIGVYILVQLLSVTTAISNQIKCCLTTNRGNFPEIQYGFYRYALLADLIDLLLKEHLRRTQEKLERDFSQHHYERSLNLCDCSSTQVSLFLSTGKAGIVNVQGRAMLCIGIWVDQLARLSTLSQSQAPSPILLKVCRNFKESQHFDLLIKMSWRSNVP